MIILTLFPLGCGLSAVMRLRITAQTVQMEGDLRLTDSASSHAQGAGRLEIYLHGEWGTVCVDGFGLTEGGVACKQLGFFPANIVGSVSDLG